MKLQVLYSKQKLKRDANEQPNRYRRLKNLCNLLKLYIIVIKTFEVFL